MPTKRVKGKKKLKSIKAKQTDGMGSTRRRAKLGKEQRKGMRGSAANYITRSQALRRLQITLKDFRRLCILKGIYPRDPKKKVKGKDKTYYYIKDVMFLAHEPVLEKFREFKTFMKRVKKAMGKKHYEEAKRVHEHRPEYSLDHIVKERYPRFMDAVADLDDALCLTHLFAAMPVGKGIEAQVTESCLKLVREWQNYVVASGALTKVFVSIKGIYYQAKVHGQNVTWLVPHQFTPTADERVDFRVMLTFLEFYQVLLKFVNFQLYTELGIAYPPKINLQLDEAGAQLATLELERLHTDKTAAGEEEENDGEEGESSAAKTPAVSKQQKESEKRIKTLAASLRLDGDAYDEENDDASATYGEMSAPLEAAFASSQLAQQVHRDLQAEATNASKLFSGLRFFLSREVPAAPLELVLRSHGAQLGWEGEGSPYSESSDRVTHHVMDRPHQGHRYFNREYIQPQWVFDSVNNGVLLPLTRYAPGAELPPHLSPFVDDAAEGYVPDYRKQLDKLKSAAQVLKEGSGGAEGDVPTGVEEELDEDEDAEEAYAAGIKAEREGGAAGSDNSEEDSESESEMEEEQKPKATKRKAAAEAPASSKKSKKEKREEEEEELHEMAVNMMSKKARRLYDRMQFGLGKKSDKIEALEAKKAQLDAAKQQQQQQQTDAAATSKKEKKKSKKSKQ